MLTPRPSPPPMCALIYRFTNSRTHSPPRSLPWWNRGLWTGRGAKRSVIFAHLDGKLGAQAPDKHNVMKQSIAVPLLGTHISESHKDMECGVLNIRTMCTAVSTFTHTRARRLCSDKNRTEQRRIACYVSHIHSVSGKRVVPFKRNPTFMCASSACLLHSCMRLR